MKEEWMIKDWGFDVPARQSDLKTLFHYCLDKYGEGKVWNPCITKNIINFSACIYCGTPIPEQYLFILRLLK